MKMSLENREFVFWQVVTEKGTAGGRLEREQEGERIL